MEHVHRQEVSAIYTLMHKDTPVAVFSAGENTSSLRAEKECVNAVDIVDRELYGKIVGGMQLQEFLELRKAPKQRAHIEELFRRLNVDLLSNFLNASYGLSLNDTVWVKPDGAGANWACANLYRNDFSDMIAQCAFSGTGLHPDRFPCFSPEFTTDGMLPKCWVREGDKVLLLKGSTEEMNCKNSGFEPYAEYYASKVAERMGFYPYVDYDLRYVNGSLASSCVLFTSEDVAYVSMDRELRRLLLTDDEYECVLERDHLMEAYKDITFFDCLICNPDRHPGNFGLLKRTDDCSVIGLSPIFDNGMSLGALWVYDNYAGEDIVAYTGHGGPLLFGGRSYVEIGRLFADSRRREAAERLIGWTIPKHPSHNWPDWKYEAMNELLQHQIKAILA